jgi:hypothetical protein
LSLPLADNTVLFEHTQKKGFPLMRISCRTAILSIFAVVIMLGSAVSQAAPKTKSTDKATSAPEAKATKAPKTEKAATTAATPTPKPAKSEKAATAKPADAKASSAAAADDMVYVTPTGKKFHKQDCPSLKGAGTAMKRSEAEAKGLTPCSKCNP